MSVVTDARDDLLGLIGIEDVSQANTPALTRILKDIRATQQEIYSLSPDFWSKDDAGEALRAPTSLTGLGLTNGSRVITGAGLATWMHGCTVRLDGESFDNQIVVTALNTYGLLVPFQGTTTASGTGTVYHDALNLANTITSVRPPVILEGEMELYPLSGKRDFQGFGAGGVSVYADGQPVRVSYPALSDRKEVDTPIGYLVEQNVQYTGVTTARLRFYPMPNAAYVLRFEVRTAPSPVTGLDDARTQLAPHGYEESIFMPLLRARFAGWVHFEGDKEQIAKDEATARQLLANLSRKQEHHDSYISSAGGW